MTPARRLILVLALVAGVLGAFPSLAFADGRPTDPTDPDRYRAPSRFVCGNVCVHWVESTRDAPPLRDANANGLPDWVETTAAVMENIWAKEVVQLGFRAPKSDLPLREHGPDGRLDVYLKDIADDVLGYCAPEIPLGYRFFDVPGFCVLDDDYSPAQLGAPNLTGLIALERTAAHEFFHAIQFGYDFAEDGWLMEGTAVWMEEQVYSALHGAYGWFAHSPLLHPEVPVDTFSGSQPFQYGAWVFWRFLEEFLSPSGPDPAVIRRVLERADGGAGQPDLYSLEAVEAVARERGSSLRAAFRAFGLANLAPASFYREGAAFPSAPVAKSFPLSAKRPAVAGQRLVLDHLTHQHVAFVPARNLGARARLTVTVDLPAPERGSEAALVTFRRTGRPESRPVPLDSGGDGSLQVPFAPASVRRVVLVLTNASARFNCYQRTALSCSGVPLDDNLNFRFSARIPR